MGDNDEIAALRARLRALEGAVEYSSTRLGDVFQLPPMLSNLMRLLLAVPTVTNVMVRKITGQPKAAISRLRRHMKKHKIHIYSRRYVGYWIEDKDKARIRAYVEAKEAS